MFSSLIEKHSAVEFGVEEAALARTAARAGPSVKKECRLARRVSTVFPINLLSVADIEHPALEGLDGRN